MKKVLLLLFLAVSFIACEGPMGPQGGDGLNGLNGKDGKDGVNGQNGTNGTNGENGHSTNWTVKSFTINANEWILDGKKGDLGSFYYVDKSFAELTSSIYTNGVVIAYIESAAGIKNGLPYIWHRWATEDKNEFLWTEKYDFDYQPGEIRFYVTYSDFGTQSAPGTETFHVVLMW